MNINLVRTENDSHTIALRCPRCGWFVIVNMADADGTEVCPYCQQEQSDD